MHFLNTSRAKRTMNILRGFSKPVHIPPLVLFVAMTGMSGCAMVPSAISHAGASKDEIVTTTIDGGALPAAWHATLQKSPRLGFIAGDATTVRLADVLNARGLHKVGLDRSLGASTDMTQSEGKDALRKICSTGRFDAVLLLRTQAVSESVGMFAGLGGRQQIKRQWTSELQGCTASQALTTSGSVVWELSIYKQPEDAEISTRIAGALSESLFDTKAVAPQQLPTKPVADVPTAKPVTATASTTTATPAPSPLPVQARIDVATVAGMYQNHSENEFIFSLNLDKAGKATYTEPALGSGKSFTMRGTWKLEEGGVVHIDFQKNGRYTYKAKPDLSWESFGCLGSSFGLEIRSTPKEKNSVNSDYHVWRSSDRKRQANCQPAS